MYLSTGDELIVYFLIFIISHSSLYSSIYSSEIDREVREYRPKGASRLPDMYRLIDKHGRAPVDRLTLWHVPPTSFMIRLSKNRWRTIPKQNYGAFLDSMTTTRLVAFIHVYNGRFKLIQNESPIFGSNIEQSLVLRAMFPPQHSIDFANSIVTDLVRQGLEVEEKERKSKGDSV